MLNTDRDALLAHAFAHCPMDPTFAPFCAWLASEDVPVAIVSDGFGFYIGPFLEREGLGHLPVITNRQRWSADGRPDGIDFVSGHPVCVGCGTCKMRAVQDHQGTHGAVAFIGEGQTDRYGALYADLVFAKDALPAYCEEDGVPFVGWDSFDDVRRALEIPPRWCRGPSPRYAAPDGRSRPREPALRVHRATHVPRRPRRGGRPRARVRGV